MSGVKPALCHAQAGWLARQDAAGKEKPPLPYRSAGVRSVWVAWSFGRILQRAHDRIDIGAAHADVFQLTLGQLVQRLASLAANAPCLKAGPQFGKEAIKGDAVIRGNSSHLVIPSR